jgi:hypothetical protein
MPRYTFHWECNERPAQDCWCVDLPDLTAAQRWAETETYNLSSVRRLADVMEGAVTIADEHDVPLAYVLAREVFGRLSGSSHSSFAA